MGGWFGILATGDDIMTIANLKIDTNRNGMDIISCRNVRVSDCTVNSPYDDGICLKSDYSLGDARTSENVTITNSQVSGYDVGTLPDGTFQKNVVYKHGDGNGGPAGRVKSSAPNRTAGIRTSAFPMWCSITAADSPWTPWTADCWRMSRFRLGSRMRAPEGYPVGHLRRVNISNFVVYNADPRYASIPSLAEFRDMTSRTLNRGISAYTMPAAGLRSRPRWPRRRPKRLNGAVEVRRDAGLWFLSALYRRYRNE